MAITTFVLGAGASEPFGFPIASQLKRRICDDPPKFCPPNRIPNESFMRDLGAFSDRMAGMLRDSGEASIDAWLEGLGNDIPGADTWGRLGIASQLAAAELAHRTRVCDDWYSWFFRRYKVKGGIDSSSFRIISFNYERSFEVALIRMLMNSFSLPRSAAVEQVGRLPICHVYGTLDYPNIDELVGGDYPLTEADIFAAADGIKIISDERASNDPNLQRARAWVAEAMSIVFLGFSFDETNLKRIGAHGLTPTAGRPSQRIYSTAYMLGMARKSDAESWLAARVTFGEPSHKCLGFLENTPLPR